MTNDGRLENWVERLSALRQYQHHGKRVPHKPLLVLMALDRLAETGPLQTPTSGCAAVPQVSGRVAGLKDRRGCAHVCSRVSCVRNRQRGRHCLLRGLPLRRLLK